MNRCAGFLAAVVLLGSFSAFPVSEAAAHTTERVKFTCPVCGTAFISPVPMSGWTFGLTDEFRVKDWVLQYRFHVCPNCRFAGQCWDFLSKAQPENPLEQAQVEALRKTADRRRAMAPSGPLYPAEKAVLQAASCEAIGVPPDVMGGVYMYAAWLHDDAGEDALAAGFRKKALASFEESLKRGRIEAEQDAWLVKCVRAALTRRLGEPAKALEMYEALVEELWMAAEVFARLGNCNLRGAPLPPRSTKPWWPGSGGPAIVFEASPLEDEGEQAEEEGKPQDKKTEKGKQEEAPPPEPPKPPTPEEILSDLKYYADSLQEQVLLGMARARQQKLGESEGRRFALKGSYYDRQAFLETWCGSNSRETAKAIDEILADPLGRGRYPPLTQPMKTWATTLDEKLANDLRSVLDEVNPSRRAASLAARVAQEHKAKEENPNSGDFNLWCAVQQLANETSPEAAAALLKDLETHLPWYAKEPLHLGKCLSCKPKAVAALAARLLDELAAGKGDAGAVEFMLDTLSCLDTNESLVLLRRAAACNAGNVRLAAIQYLVIKRDPGAKDRLLEVLPEAPRRDIDTFEPGEGQVQRALVRLVTKEDYEKLERLARNPPKVFRQDRAAAGPPLWLLAAMASADPARGIPAYEARIDKDIRELVAATENARKSGKKAREREQKARSILYRLYDVANLLYLPRTGPYMAAALNQDHLKIGWEHEKELAILYLGRAAAQDQAEALAALVARPVPVSMKLELINASRSIKIRGMDEALRRWSTSANKELAAAAKEALEAGPMRRQSATAQ